MPWVHLHINTQGLVKACCDANITLGNIREKSIAEIWNDEPIRKFRRSLLDGKKDKRCLSCYRKEEAGKSSMRLETLNKFEGKMDWVKETTGSGESKSSKPIYLDIRFNNLCNLRCRTCWHGASSSWFEEAKAMKNNAGPQAIISASPDNMILIDQLTSNNHAIEEVYFAGGEPLMMMEHYDLLNRLLASGQLNVRLRYNTNLSNFQLRDQNVVTYWRQFTNVIVSASIDGLERQAEYIRKGLNWDKFIDNMNLIVRDLPHVKLEIAPTVSVFNILSLPALHRYFVDQGLIGINDIYLNLLSRPDFYNIKILPFNLKMEAIKRLESHMTWLADGGADQSVVSEFQGIINFINQDDWSSRIPIFQRQIQRLDEMRSESFKDTFPELTMVLDHA